MSSTDRYADMTDDQFDGILEGIVDTLTAAQILALPGVYEVLREELNNDVLALWEQDHPEQTEWECESCGNTVDDPLVDGLCAECNGTGE